MTRYELMRHLNKVAFERLIDIGMVDKDQIDDIAKVVRVQTDTSALANRALA